MSPKSQTPAPVPADPDLEAMLARAFGQPGAPAADDEDAAAVEPEVVEKIVSLEQPVLLDHLEILRADEGLQDGRGDVRMVVGAEGVADVVQQRADDVFLVAAVLQREGGGLQAVRQPVHREAAEVAVEQPQVCQDAVRQGLRHV